MNIAPALLALDHLTVPDTTPSQLIAVAAQVGCPAVCMFLEPMAVLPRMPAFDLIGDTPERRETRRQCEDQGICIDLAYPFTLAARTQVEAFRPLMETAAWLGVRALNTLLYDRDPLRRFDTFAAFCELAAEYGFVVAVEFYPLSQIRSLGEALELVARVGRPERVGVNIDLLHLMRSGARIEEIRKAPPNSIVYAQFCDGPQSLERELWGAEASYQRLPPGEGQFDVAGFAQALPQGVPCSVEVPQELQIAQGMGVRERAVRALQATRYLIQDFAADAGPLSREVM
jgi:sugar phosphate isomerase/epimerase